PRPVRALADLARRGARHGHRAVPGVRDHGLGDGSPGRDRDAPVPAGRPAARDAGCRRWGGLRDVLLLAPDLWRVDRDPAADPLARRPGDGTPTGRRPPAPG